MFVIGFAGYSGSGKTTLIRRLIPQFSAQGLSVSVVKHTHHPILHEDAHADTQQFLLAGAQEAILVNATQQLNRGICRPTRGQDLSSQLAALKPCDLVLVEGYKKSKLFKLEVYGAAAAVPLLCRQDEQIKAVISDYPLEGLAIPVFQRNDLSGIHTFIYQYYQQAIHENISHAIR